MNRASDFEACFKALTGHPPFPWQQRLHEQFVNGAFPPACNLPTGLGKTSVLAIWLLALAEAPPGRVPRRLAYVVNRRTIVDQATEEAKRFAQLINAKNEDARFEVLKELRKVSVAAPSDELDKLRGQAAALTPLRASLLAMAGLESDHDLPLAISTLRGQFADNGEWSADPARPAIVVGTVDMIGSRLLFSGYGRCGFKSRPLHAGFLGQDTLLVHDEAHLEPAFQHLIETIECEQKCRERASDLPWPKLRVMSLTATLRSAANQTEKKQENEKPSGLTDEEKNPPEQIPEPADDEPPIHRVWRRLKAKKELCLQPPVGDDKQVPGKIAEIAAGYKDMNAAVLVFVRTLEAVGIVEKELKKYRKVVPLTGTIRGKERDELVERPEFKRFLKDATRGETVYLVCTSAGEVGIDISADHMVCDLTTFESMAQRLGRVNRYAEPSEHVARIDVVYPASFGKIDKKTGESKADEIDKRRQKTLDLLKQLPVVGDNRHNASPLALNNLDAAERRAAFAPDPTILDATDILFDAWALTSIRGKMPGRPEVAPYLHGVADDSPQTTIAWRAELDLIDLESPDAEKTLQAIFAKHHIRAHETLTVGMSSSRGKWNFRAIEFLEEAVAKRPDLRDAQIALRFARGQVRLTTLENLIKDPGPLYADPTLILPASFGGLKEGMLSADALPAKKEKLDASDDDSADEERKDAPVSDLTLDIADIKGYEPRKNAEPRLRVIIKRKDGKWSAEMLSGDKPPAEWALQDSYEKSTHLVNDISEKSRRRVSIVQTIESDQEEDTRCLVCLSPVPERKPPAKPQLLDEHVSEVEKKAARLADALPRDHKVANAALRFAAKWHDEGKKAPCWQRYIGNPDPESGQPLGKSKSAKWCNPKRLAGFRHEFGSLLRIPEGEACRYFADPRWKFTPEEQEHALDLALHLIAAHHGYARPHFDNALDADPKIDPAKCEPTHMEVLRRFARLQRRYGRWGLAYLESLLRAADIAASREVGIGPDEDDGDAEEGDGGDA